MSFRFLHAALATAAIGAGAAWAQQAPVAPARSDNPVSNNPVVLDWTPPALAQLSEQATTRSSFTLDRNLLALAAGMAQDADAQTRQAIAKIDGVSVHVLRFGDTGVPDESAVEAVRKAYHLRGWKHLVTTEAGGLAHNGTTDVWLVLDGVNVRGAVVLVESPKSVTLATMAGNLSPIDVLHLRGHFGIPRFDGDGFKDSTGK
jgi:hypothetical protein